MHLFIQYYVEGRDTFPEHFVTRNPPPRKLSRYSICDKRTLRVVQGYANYDVTNAELTTISKWSISISDIFSGHLCDCKRAMCEFSVKLVLQKEGFNVLHNHEN